MNDVAVILYSVTRATCVNNGPAGLRLRFLVCRLPVARGYMRYSCDFSKKIPSCHRPYYVTSLQRRLSSDSVCPRTGYCLRGSIVDKLCVLLDSCFCGRRRVFFSSILSCFCRCCVQLEECGHDCVPSVLIPPHSQPRALRHTLLTNITCPYRSARRGIDAHPTYLLLTYAARLALTRPRFNTALLLRRGADAHAHGPG